MRAIVTDLNMPRMDGFELIRRVRADRTAPRDAHHRRQRRHRPRTLPTVSPSLASARFFPSPTRPRRCAVNWSRYSMPPLSKLCGLAALAWPFLAGAQTPDLARILERLDRLEARTGNSPRAGASACAPGSMRPFPRSPGPNSGPRRSRSTSASKFRSGAPKIWRRPRWSRPRSSRVA